MGHLKGYSTKIRIGTADQAVSDIWSSAPDPLLSSFEYSTSVSSDKVSVLGRRDPIDIVMGTQEITGSLERGLYSQNASNQIVYNGVSGTGESINIDLLTATGLYGGELTECIIVLNTTDRSATDYNLVIRGVKFHSYSTSKTPDDLTTEKVDFDATNLSTA